MSPPDFLILTAISNATPFAELFRRKFGHPLPETGDHFVAFHRDEAGALWPLSYLNFGRFGDAVEVASDELPVFWACGVTPQAQNTGSSSGITSTASP